MWWGMRRLHLEKRRLGINDRKHVETYYTIDMSIGGGENPGKSSGQWSHIHDQLWKSI